MKSIEVKGDNIASNILGKDTYEYLISIESDNKLPSYFDDDEPKTNEEDYKNFLEQKKKERREKIAPALKKRKETVLKLNIMKNNIALSMAKRILYKSLIYCPIDTGALRRSAKLSITRRGMVISYGDSKVYYASYVHEIPRYKHTPPTQAKFLEEAVKEVIAEYSAVYSKYKIDVDMPSAKMLTYSGENNKIAAFVGFSDENLKGVLKSNYSKLGKDISNAVVKEDVADMFKIYDDYERLEAMDEFSKSDWHDALMNQRLEKIANKDGIDVNDEKSIVAFFYNALYK